MDTALAKKLMMEKFKSILLLNKPQDINEFNDINVDTTKVRDKYDLVFSFVFNLEEMKQIIEKTHHEKLLEDRGYLYIAYPKKGNKQYPMHIDRDSIFPYLNVNDEDGIVEGTTLAFSKMVAFNEVFTLIGLKEASKKPARSQVSARVDDYISFIPQLKIMLKTQPEVLAIYEALSQGYQKDWARYVFSAKTETTKEKRLLEMIDILQAGYKTRELYRQGKK